MKLLLRISFLLTFLYSISFAQVEEVYYETGELKSATPLNAKGILEGESFSYYKSGAVARKRQFRDGQQTGLEQEFYPSGKLKAESNYAYGRVHGLRLEYYQNGDLKLKEHWHYGHREGVVIVYYPGEKMRMFGIVDGDDLQFAQRFDETGRLLTERISAVSLSFEFDALSEPRYFLKRGKALQPGVNLVQAFIPKIPQRFLSYDSPSGRITFSNDPKYPLILRPNTGESEFLLNITVKADEQGIKPIQKRIRIPVLQ